MTTPDPDTALDLAAIRDEWLNQCGPCDAGLPMGCACSDSDPRPMIARLATEVERLSNLLHLATSSEAGWRKEADERAAEVERLRVPPADQVLRELEERRTDEEFMARVRARVATDHDMLQRIGEDELLIADLRARAAHHEARAETAEAALAAERERVAERDAGLSDYLAAMDRAGGGVYTTDFRDGFRHALAMLAAYEGDKQSAADRPSPAVREAAREALNRRAAITPDPSTASDGSE